MYTPKTDPCDLVAYRSWMNRSAAPAYMRGVPTWVWQAAMCRRKSPRLAVVAR